VSVKRIAVLVVLLGAAPSGAGQPLSMAVSPTAALEPAIITVRAFVESNPDNRALQVTAQSPDFYRSSYVELDGANAQRLTVFQFRNLPRGTYEVTSVLVGSKGPRASAGGFFQVARSVGR
jgi:hypothetical protein